MSEIVELGMILNALSPKLQAEGSFSLRFLVRFFEDGYNDLLATVRQSEGVKQPLPVKAAGIVSGCL